MVGVAVAAGVGLRAAATSDLWVDEALTVNIAKLPVHGILEALRHDGHPPLYYLLLHGWMSVFGQSDAAVRALSGLFSVATLPVIWLIGKRVGGRRCAVAAIVLLATSPQAVRYGTETRMYALVVLLASLGWLAVHAALRAPTIWRLVAVGACAAALLLTHYWSSYLLTGTVLLLLWLALRGDPTRRRAAWLIIGAMVAGSCLFLPWLPTFIEQIRKTGAPWAAPARPAQVLYSLLTGTDPPGEAQLLGVVLAVLAMLALFGRPIDEHRIELDLRTRPEVRWESGLIILVLSLAVIGGQVSAVAFAPRYTAVVFPMLILVAAMGIARLPTKPIRIGALGAVAALGLAGSLHAATVSRTQLGDVGRALGKGAKPGDLVVYCPDQLAPSVLRYAPDGLAHLTYPQTATPERIDWVAYSYRVKQVDPVAFAALVNARSANRPVWLVWSEGYSLLGHRCESMVTALDNLRPRHDIVVTKLGTGAPTEQAWLYRFDPN